jgi:DNA-binding MarR family transcriptional regulator
MVASADMPDRLHLDRFLPFLLSVTSNRVSERVARAYDALFALSIPGWRLLAVIAEAGPITQAELVEHTYMDKVTVSRAASALVERGAVARSPNAADRRSHHLTLTAQGRALYAQIAPEALKLEERIFSRFTPAELEQFVTMLRRIDAAAEAA